VRVDLLTREYPPEVYGGAGVHVEYLARSLRELTGGRSLGGAGETGGRSLGGAGETGRRSLGGAGTPGGPELTDVRVHCFGAPRDEPGVTGYADPSELAGTNPALRTLGVDLAMVDGTAGTDLVHSHTWYANLAGHISKLLYGVPHVATAHSLEPLRPWKAEQLGGGYQISVWCERTALEAADAVIAVSKGMRADVLAAYPAIDPDRVPVVHNGIDTDEYQPDPDTDVVARLGIDPDAPSVVFVGRTTRQKGLPYLLRAAVQLPPEVQLVLLAGAPDTPEIATEVSGLVDSLRSRRSGVVWVQAMLPKAQVIQVLSHATVFACPSVYEPMGIVNLEAMACQTAVVATATGGIPEVVADGTTGVLVPIEQEHDGTPVHPDQFVADLAAALTDVATDPARAAAMGKAGRERAVEHFSWRAVAQQTMDVYRSVLA
jgi:starch synthase